MSVSYIYKALGRRRVTGETTARTGRAGREAKLAALDEALRVHVSEHADATLEELKAWLAAECKIKGQYRVLGVNIAGDIALRAAPVMPWPKLPGLSNVKWRACHVAHSKRSRRSHFS